MHSNRSDIHGHLGARSARTGAPRATARAGLTALLAALTTFGTLVLADATPASASTLNGIATISSPGGTTPLTSGSSTAAFTVALPAQAACDADTAAHGYHVYSYLVHKGTTLSGVTFIGFPSAGFGLVDNTGTYYGAVNTATTTGQIVSVPNNFEWGPLVSGGGVTLSQLLYTGSGTSASGIWEAGLACANSSGILADNWNTEVIFNAKAGAPNGFTWTAVPGPSGSAPAAFTSANSTTFTLNAASTFTPTASGTPAPTITEAGALPTGVTFTGGVLKGTPTATGTFPISFTAHNGILGDATQSFTLTVSTGVSGFHIVTTSLSPGTAKIGTPYASAALVATGGTTPYKWKVTTGKLPKGLKLNAKTGVVSGTVKVSKKAPAPGPYPFTVTVTDHTKGTKKTATASFVLALSA